MAWRRHDEASTASIGLMIAAATMSIAFVTANFLVEEPGGADIRVPQLDASATAALEVIVQQPGRAHSGASWLTDPDGIARFGMALDGMPNFLDYRAIKVMRNGTIAQTANDAPDYEDVRAALGIESGDFHVRTYPVIPGLDDPRWTKDPRGRAAYVAQAEKHASAVPGAATVTTTPTVVGNTLNVTLDVRNDAAFAFVYSVEVELESMGAVPKLDERHTRLLAPGETQRLYVNFPRISGSAAVDEVEVRVFDAYGDLIIPSVEVDAPVAPAGSATYGMVLAAGSAYYVTGSDPMFRADHYKADGSRFNSGQSARFVLTAPDGSTIVNASVTLPKNKAYEYRCTSCTATGVYTATIWEPSYARKAVDMVYVSATELVGTELGSVLPVAAKEIQILDDLVAVFNPTVYDEVTNPEGDVFLADGKVRELPDVLSRYSFLVVGSDVDQNDLNSGDIKWEIRDWVLAGGNLIALGRTDGHTNWLQPVFGASQSTASGAISAPDATHPVLTTPNRLEYPRYTDLGQAWEVPADDFSHVLTRGASSNGQEMRDALTVNDPGAYDDGTLVLTSYMPGTITTPQDDAEAKKFLHNLLSQSYTMLFLDYGPPIPSGVPVGSAQRLVAVPHPNVPGAVVEVRIVLYVW